MPLNNSQEDIIAHRREAVARLRLRHLSQREICAKLAEEGIINIEENKPWSLGTINLDLKSLDAQWKRQAMNHVTAKKGLLLAEYYEVLRVAWQSDDLAIILRACKQIAELLGLDAPERTEISGTDGGPVEINDARVALAEAISKIGELAGP
jgi:hypothetical protein